MKTVRMTSNVNSNKVKLSSRRPAEFHGSLMKFNDSGLGFRRPGFLSFMFCTLSLPGYITWE